MSSYEAAHHSRDEPPYLAPYGLQTAPFPSGHDDRFLYLDANRQQQLEMLRELTGYNQLLLTVIGEWGIGKTSLKQRYINSADSNWLISEINGHPMMDAEELLSTIAQGFGLIDIPASPAGLQNNLYQYLAGLQHKDTIPVLIVDDAHELSQEALEALFYLCDAEASEGNLLRTILFCEPSISVMLDSTAIEPLKQRITHSMKLTPFDEQQTAEYLRHRLAVAGLEGSNPFSPTEIKRIYNASEGIPEKINETAHLVLCGDELDDLDILDDVVEVESTAPRSLNIRHVITGAMAILVIAAVLIWQQDIRQVFNKPAATSIASVTEDGPQSIQTGEAAGEASADKTIQLGVTEPAQHAASDSEVESTQAGAGEATASSTTDTAPAAAPDEVKSEPALVVSAIEPDPVPASDKQQTLTLKGKGFDATTRITVEWANQRKTLLQNRLHLVNENRLDFDISVGTKPDTWVVIVRNPQTGARAKTQFVVKPVVTKTATLTANHPDSLEDLAWLKHQPANHYTLQLLASPQTASLQEFVKQYDLAGKAVMFESSTKDGQPWYALAYGSYPSQQAAEQASQTLPAGIKPWIRRFASIQEGLASQPVAAAIPANSVPQSNNLQDHAAWLWAQNPSHYTLQLLAGRNEQAVQQFIARHHLAGQAVFYQTTREDKPWYVLVMGSFADRTRALGARDKLPADLRQQSPWPRAFSEIHADLSRH